MRIKDSNPTRFYHARQENILNLGDDPVVVISNSAIPSIRPPVINLLFSLYTLVTPSVLNRASGFLSREAVICLERSSHRAGFFLPST